MKLGYAESNLLRYRQGTKANILFLTKSLNIWRQQMPWTFVSLRTKAIPSVWVKGNWQVKHKWQKGHLMNPSCASAWHWRRAALLHSPGPSPFDQWDAESTGTKRGMEAAVPHVHPPAAEVREGSSISWTWFSFTGAALIMCGFPTQMAGSTKASKHQQLRQLWMENSNF